MQGKRSGWLFPGGPLLGFLSGIVLVSPCLRRNTALLSAASPQLKLLKDHGLSPGSGARGEYSSGGEPFDIDFRGVALAGTLDQAELLISAVQLY